MMDSLFEKIERFFERIKNMGFIKVLLLAWGIYMVWTLLVGGILLLCGATFSQNVAPTTIFKNSFLILPMAAFLEEVLFRWLPMVIISFGLLYFYRIGKLTKKHFFLVERYCLLVLVIVSSIIFGWVHGNIFNVLLQGVTGILIFIIYLRCFFIERDKGVNDRLQIIPLAEATIYHSLANLLSVVV